MSEEPLKIRVNYDVGQKELEERVPSVIQDVGVVIEAICERFNIPCSDNSEEGHEYVEYTIG